MNSIENTSDERMAWSSSIPFFLMHAACGLAFVVGFHWQWIVLCIVSYYVRMFFITAGYHRYFAHRAFQTGRVFQFVMAFMAQTSMQKGALWWSSWHRHHHRESDQPADIHSPTLKGFWYSHVGWILCHKNDETHYEAIKDFARFPELRWLNRNHLVPPIALFIVLWAIGGVPWLLWGGVISTVALWHGTFTINSLSHIFGVRRYLTTDTSRNNWLLALVTLGEGWHNNHHYHQNTANQGWFWWEIDISYYVLRALSWVGIVKKLRLPGEETRFAHLKYTQEQKVQLRTPARFFRNKVAIQKFNPTTLRTQTLPYTSPISSERLSLSHLK